MTAYLDNLTAKLTCFKTFAELAACMNGGYVPTVRPEFGRRYVILRRILRAKGFRVFPYTID